MTRGRWLGLGLGFAVFAAMLAWTWGTWCDAIVDFGGELYVPWRLAEGDVLYRDVAYFTGPLSPYLNALVFRVLGTSLLSLVLANLAVLGGIAFLLHRILAKAAGELAAAAGLVIFLLLFAFAQLEEIGNSNYVCPYAHETTHGALLALLLLVALERWLDRRRLLAAAAIGLLLGLAFLTKVEVFLAMAGAASLGLALGFRRDRVDLSRALATVLGCALLPVAVASGALATAMPARDALHGTLGAWPYTLEGKVADLAFYRWVLGTDRPAANLGRLLVALGAWVGIFAPVAAIAVFLVRRLKASFLVGAATAVALLLALRPSPTGWIEAGRALPALALVFLVPPLVAALRRRDDASSALAAAFAAYALAMLAKMVLHARINMYGFALAMPAAMLAVAALVGWIPAWIDRKDGNGALFRGFALGVLGVAAFEHLRVMQFFLERKTVVVGVGRDAFRADARGAVVGAAVEAVKAKLPPGGTLVALPEGILVNYLARAKAPVRYINYMPPEVLMFGEERIVADLDARPPDLVLLVHKSTAEYGLPWFGKDYGRAIAAWVRARYRPGALLGDEPLMQGSRFGMRVLERIR